MRHEAAAPFTTAALETFTAPDLISYIRELEAGYQQRIQVLESNMQTINNDFILLKEKYDLLVYKRFVRSAEQLLADLDCTPVSIQS